MSSKINFIIVSTIYLYFTTYLFSSNYLYHLLFENSLSLLLSILVLLIFFIVLISFISEKNTILIKQLGLFASCLTFILTLILWIIFNNEIGNFVFVVHLPWLSSFNIYYSLGIDGISIFFIILTAFLMPICILISWNSIVYKLK